MPELGSILGFGHDTNFARTARCQTTIPPVIHAAADVRMVRDFSKGCEKAPGVRAVFNVAGLAGKMGGGDWFIADYVVAVIAF